MKSYLLTFECMTPLMLSERQTTQTTRSVEYISGSTLLGGLAGAYLRMHNLSPETIDDTFKQFFLNNLIRFGNLYPANFASSRTAQEPVKPLPHTARSCKRWEDHHGVVDHLMLWALFKTSRDLKIFEKNRYCQTCRKLGITERLDSFRGYYQRYAPEEYEWSSHLNRRLITGTGINRLTGTVKDEILFNYEAIAELTIDHQPQQFQGVVHLDESVAQTFEEFLNDDAFDLRVGKAKTRGFGRLRLLLYHPANTVTLDQFTDRLTRFDSRLKQVAQDTEVELNAPFHFAITCCSDLILRTQDLRYHTCLDKETLAKKLKLADAGGLKLVYHHASTVRTIGWNALWRLPKPVELAVEKGSVFLFSYTGDSQQDLIDKLYRLEQEGIGSRKPEGFGWVTVSDEFHQEGIEI